MKLSGEKVILRPIETGDYLAIFENIQDVNIALYNGVPFPYSQEAARRFIEKMLKKMRQGKRLQMAILEKMSGRMVGLIGLKFHRNDGPVASLGYWMGENFRSRGYMGEAMGLMLEMAFSKLKLEKLQARVYLPNLISARLVEKFGFQVEGVLRKQIQRMGVVMDAAVYGLLKEEYLRAKSR